MRFLLTHDLLLIFVSRTGSPSSRHGKMSALALIISILCFICSYFATTACSYVQIEGALYSVPPYGMRGDRDSGVGLFRHEAYMYWGSCSSYSSDMMDNASYFDGAFKASRAFGLMANVCIGFGMICLMVRCCVEFNPKAMKFLGFLFAAGSLFQLLTFSLFASSVCEDYTSCQISTGAYFAIVSTILALLTAVLTCTIPPANDTLEGSPPNVALPEPGTKTITETVMPDGTKNITETTVNADGSQTVTKSVIQPEKV
jgi:hypothetical protein